jgi:hypothetical protein
MKKILLTFAVICAAAATPAVAQKVTYTCQYVAAAGLFWQHGNGSLPKNSKEDRFLTGNLGGRMVQIELM